MLQALDYFNTKKPDVNNRAQSKLLSTLLIRRFINHTKNFIYLTDLETKIYYKMPRAIKNILEKIYKIFPLKNYTAPENFQRINPKKVNVLRNNLNDYSQSVKKTFSNFGQQLFNWWNSKPTQ